MSNPITQAVEALEASHDVLRWLNGEIHDAEGLSFSDSHPTKRGAFWWREKLRPLLKASSPIALRSLKEGQGEAVAYRWRPSKKHGAWYDGWPWKYSDGYPELPVELPLDHFEVEPVYLFPPPASGWNEAAARWHDEQADFFAQQSASADGRDDAESSKEYDRLEREHKRSAVYFRSLTRQEEPRAGIPAVREALRETMLLQRTSEHGRETYTDGFTQGLAYAIGALDRALLAGGA